MPTEVRPRIRFHLSTCLVVMLAAAALLWVNLQYRSSPSQAPGFASGGVFRVTYVHACGWPFTIYGGYEETDAWGTYDFPTDGDYWEKFPDEMPAPTYRMTYGEWFPKGIAGNAIAALLFLALAALATEQVIRWRARSSKVD